jgi:hypothetical protein
MKPVIHSKIVRAVLAAAIIIGCAGVIPRLWCGRGARAMFDGRLAVQAPLAAQVEQWVLAGVDESDFHTGSEHMNQEWAYATYQMAGLGFGQIILAHPETRARYLPALDRCIERMQSPELNVFAERQWGESGFSDAALATDHGHAYLGYLNLLLSLRRLIDRDNPSAALNDRLTAALARRIERAPAMMIETYPGGSWPADVSACVGSIGLNDRALGNPEHRALLDRWGATLSRRYTDPASGLLIQRIDFPEGAFAGQPRGSGTVVAMYFISFADRELAAELYRSFRGQCRRTLLGFGAAREYPPGVFGLGDIDSGIVVFGLGIAPSSFAYAGARTFGDFEFYRELYRTGHLAGVPLTHDGRTNYLAGGPLGNAIMLAVLTAGPAAAPAREAP